jgi:hypothetical protein
MYRYRTPAFAAAAALVLTRVGILTFRHGTQIASVWGDWIDTIAPLVAAVVCWLVSRQSPWFGKRVWRLVAFACVLGSIGEGLYTYYYDYLHAPFGTLWPSDVLVFFWIVPIVMTLFLRVHDPGSGYGWLRVCDFAQVCTLALAFELSQIYVPSRWAAAGATMEIRVLHASILFFSLVTISFLVRALLTPSRTERRFFLRMDAFLAFHGIVLTSTMDFAASGHYMQGLWRDLPWTISYCLPMLMAATWSEPEEEPAAKPGSRSLELLAQFAPLLIPAIVFPLVLSVAKEQFLWSVVLVLISFGAASGRLFLVQNQLLISSRELQKNSSARHHRRHH